LAALADKSSAVEDKRRQLIDAAVRVFARKGFHASRVGDIAEEAGVAHGLLYHYFKSKDEVLQAVFHENWSLLVARIESVEQTDEPAADQLRHISAIVLRTWLHLPDVVRVVIQEFGRSPELAERIGELTLPIDALQRAASRPASSAKTSIRPSLRRSSTARSTSC
jgi:AcrR family transcriptional regulator